MRLKFTPTIAGDLIRLKVEPEVSSLDFNNGITLQGYRIPALIMRRAQTDVELRDGQSFAIAGLLQNVTQENGSAIPLLSQPADHRQPVQEQVRPEAADRVDGAHHAAARASRSSPTRCRRSRWTRSGSSPGRGSAPSSREAEAWWTRRR